MDLKELRHDFNELKKNGYANGFTKTDYSFIKTIQNQLSSYQDLCVDLYNETESLMNKLYYNGLFNKYSERNVSYIQKNAWLLPLVLANKNNSFFKVKGSNVYFLCHFHQENTPSMYVRIRENFGHCFGCGESFDVVTYLMKYENISFKEALDLLSAIYLFDVKDISDKEKNKAFFYQKAVLSQEYKDTLMESLEKFEKNHTLSETQILIKEYNQILKGIERVRNHEYDPNFVYDEPIRRVYLKN